MNNSWYELKHISVEKYKSNNYKGLELEKVKLLIEQNKTNNEIISTFNETSMTPENLWNLISSVILTILYTSVYFILFFVIILLLSYNIMFKYSLLFYLLHSYSTLLMDDFIQLPKRNAGQEKFRNTMNKSF